MEVGHPVEAAEATFLRPDQIHKWQNDIIFKDDLLAQWKSACL